jgi:hypothetical protein
MRIRTVIHDHSKAGAGHPCASADELDSAIFPTLH